MIRQSALAAGILLHLILPLAGAVSLTDFQKLTVTVSVPCAIAYDSTIPGCTDSDFEGDNLCSASCVAGLNKIQNSVQQNCHGVVANSEDLLGEIFNGLIIPSLCP